MNAKVEDNIPEDWWYLGGMVAAYFWTCRSLATQDSDLSLTGSIAMSSMTLYVYKREAINYVNVATEISNTDNCHLFCYFWKKIHSFLEHQRAY